MTWSITKSKLVGGQPIVKWKDTPLRQLSDETFVEAVNAASALGEVVVLEATEVRPGLAEEAAQADVIVLAVMHEMENRASASAEDREVGTGNAEEIPA